jgi:hypothetical protein
MFICHSILVKTVIPLGKPYMTMFRTTIQGASS